MPLAFANRAFVSPETGWWHHLNEASSFVLQLTPRRGKSNQEITILQVTEIWAFFLPARKTKCTQVLPDQCRGATLSPVSFLYTSTSGPL